MPKKPSMPKDPKDSKKSTKGTKGITVTKADDLSEWFTQVIQKAELIDYSPVSGCYILRPNAYAMWETVQRYFDCLITDDGVQNCSFPMFIPESLLAKEKSHVEGFSPEVAWVETGGHTKLKERLAIRPTSETIMYDAYAKWIRSHKDLPLRLNQWNSVVRWEFKHPIPFIRSREFHWQEGHTAFAAQEEALEEALRILQFYEKVFKELYAVPVLAGKKAESEKFAGAEVTFSVEVLLPNGKAAQGATSHHLGQNFSKAFGISFLDENQQSQYAWQNSWGLSTRSIGLMIMVHGDDKGLIVPPRLAPVQVVIVPIFFDESKAKVINEANALANKLKKKGLRAHLDDRDGYSAGWKFNEWEVKGIPVRIEIGPRDLQKKQAMVVRRDTGEKKALKVQGAEKKILLLLEQIHSDMYARAEASLKSSIAEAKDMREAQKHLDNKKLIYAPWCGTASCEESFKEKTGAKPLNSPFTQPKVAGNCFACASPATARFYFGRSY